jgi:hypothetical protein
MKPMGNLAELIRKGLETGGVIEDQQAFGVAIEDDEIHASCVGLALIGKIGLNEALRLYKKIVEESGMKNSPASSRVSEELGADAEFLESLTARHCQSVSATEIADELEAGTFKVLA